MQITAQATCIIPFYNEEDRVLQVLEVVTQIKGITQIICIDDGSTDDTSDQILAHWPQVTLVRLPYNRGNAAAIRQGVRHAKNQRVRFMHADLQSINKAEVEKASQAMGQHNLD